MRNEIENLVEELNNMFYTDGGYKSFPIDVIEEKNAYHVYAEIPGVAKEDIQITFEDGTLSITAERKAKADTKYLIRERGKKKYARSIYFGDINEESITGKYTDGILEVMINTKAPEVKEKKLIEIQ